MSDQATPSPQPAPDPTPTSAPTGPTSDERLWSVLAHVTFFVFGIIGPLLIWLLHDKIIKHHSSYIEHHAKQATIYQIAAAVITTILAIVTCGVGGFIVFVFMIFPILAAIEANKGHLYSYPMMQGITADGGSEH